MKKIFPHLRNDEELEALETCGSVTKYIFDYLWSEIGKSGPTPILTMYDDNPEDTSTYNKPTLEEEFPFMGFGTGQYMVHFVFQGENGAWEDLTGSMYSHEYVIFDCGQRFWSCQAWAGEYKTRWHEIYEPGFMTSTLNMSNIDMDHLRGYFYLNDVPEGFWI